MFSKKTVLALLSTLVLLLVIAAQCGAPATPQTVVETVVVTQAGEKAQGSIALPRAHTCRSQDITFLAGHKRFCVY